MSVIAYHVAIHAEVRRIKKQWTVQLRVYDCQLACDRIIKLRASPKDRERSEIFAATLNREFAEASKGGLP